MRAYNDCLRPYETLMLDLLLVSRLKMISLYVTKYNRDGFEYSTYKAKATIFCP